MELATIEMDKAEARERFLEYKRAVDERHTEEDAAVMRGYRELAKGKQLVHIVDTVRAGGLDDDGRPRLAVCRADEQWCRLSMNPDGSLTFIGRKVSEEQYRIDHRSTKRRVSLPSKTFEELRYEYGSYWGNVRAMVPMVPPALRPAHHLRNYHILWEATWEAAPPVDPALLKHVGGYLYAVIQVWDLTDLERAVLGHRRVDLP